MASRAASTLEVNLRLVDSEETGSEDLIIELRSRSSSPVTGVLLLRYFILEMKSVVGQYFRGTLLEQPPLGLPARGDYRRLASGETASLRLSLVWTPSDEDETVGAYTVGGHRFARVPSRNTLRVTYRADQIMPNLPSGERRSFFAGPIDAELELVRGSLYRPPPPAPRAE